VWANWPMPNASDAGLVNPESYDASSTDLVRDTVTGLTWQKILDTSPVSDGGAEAISLSWSEAVAYCANLSLDNGGWRMPARIELISLLNVTADPAIDPISFPDTPQMSSGPRPRSLRMRSPPGTSISVSPFNSSPTTTNPPRTTSDAYDDPPDSHVDVS